MPSLAGISREATPGELARRAVRAREMLRSCALCEWRCGVDRTRGRPAPCRLGADTHVFKQYVSLGDEPEARPSLRVYVGGCNFRCRFCNTAPGCFEPSRGRRVEATKYAAELVAAVRREGVRAISVLGGEPTLHLHTLLELAAAAPGRLPLAINTNLYMTPEVLELLKGVVAVYLADFKFGNDRCARELAGVERYVSVVQRNLLLIRGNTPLVVRHLLMPGHMACCFRPVVDWLAERLPGVRLQLHTGYVPCDRAGELPGMARLNTRAERDEAVTYLRGLNLDWECGHERRTAV